jgi:cyclin-dependent kinase 2
MNITDENNHYDGNNKLLSNERYVYNKSDKLGEGTYGIVYKGVDLVTKNAIAIKKIRLENEDEGMPSTTMREIAILKELSHPSIIQLLNVKYLPNEKRLDLVFEYVEFDLKKYLKKYTQPLHPDLIKSFMRQLLKGIIHCHDRRIIHRDLKPQNLLIDANTNSLKIADFGLARAFSVPIRTLTHEIETLWYRAPEVLLGQKEYSLGVDTWAIGCIFAELFERRPIFAGDSEIDQIFKIFQYHGTPTDTEWTGISSIPHFKNTFPKFRKKSPQEKFKKLNGNALDLVLRLIELDPARRISAVEALSHPYFND